MEDHHPVHAPVMVAEVVAGLNIRPGCVYVDGTVGEGGHALAILDQIAQEGELLGLDRNPVVLQATARRLARHTSTFRLFHQSFSHLGEVLGTARVPTVAGILLDLGLSLYLLERSGRGFSFVRDEPLDMRFDPEEVVPTAAHFLNTSPEGLLEKIFRDYGEEPRARRLARLIVQERRKHPFETTRQLADLVQQALGGKKGRLHPATRVFQALRVAVNRELKELESFLTNVPAWLAPGGRLVILSYHSLEDRLVKQHLQGYERAGIMRRLTKKPLSPTLEEVRQNPRARSARLRVAEKL